jgi:hypothetical protein
MAHVDQRIGMAVEGVRKRRFDRRALAVCRQQQVLVRA